MNNIINARKLVAECSYDRALDIYVSVLEENPQLKPLFEAEYRSVLEKYNEDLESDNEIESIIRNYNTALQLYPNNIFFANESGRYHLMFGRYDEASILFQQALLWDAGSVNAEKGLNTVKNVLIERWHFRMLNDKIRNDNYRAAIHEKVAANESRVLDLGTGTGLLAMYATEGKPRTVAACDSSSLMTTITECVLAENKLRMAVKVINNISTALTEKDIGKKCSLLVTELFDAGLFGEHILMSLHHAWEHLLSENAKIVPHKAEFFIMGVHSELLNSKYQLREVTKSFLKLGSHLNIHATVMDETYDCDDIHLYKDLKYITESHSLFKIDFTDLNDIKQKLLTLNPYHVQCKALQSGQINMFIGWFNLYLTENICITTNPRNENRANAWQQAIFYNHIPINVEENDTVSLEFFIKCERITMKTDCSEIIKVSQSLIRFLNDVEYLTKIRNSIGMSCIYLGQMTDMSEVKIIDLNPFPFFGLLMLQRGIKSLICYAKTTDDKEFFKKVFISYGVNMEDVIILVGDDLKKDYFENEKFHLIFVNILDLGGDLDLNLNEIGLYLKSNNLITGGLFMPHSVTIIGQIVNSRMLSIANRVDDENVGYTISKYVNRYQVSQNYHIDYMHLEYTPLTDPVRIGLWNRMIEQVLNVRIKRDGDANAILCWYNIELLKNCEVISTKRSYSFIDGTAYLADPPIPMATGVVANILHCVDSDGSYKLIIDKENT